MLQGIGRATLAPRALLISAATFSQASALRLETTTLAPCSARRCTMASPMPLVEPVTSATFPLKSKSDMGFLAVFWNFGVAILRHTRGWRQMPRFPKIWVRPHDLFFWSCPMKRIALLCAASFALLACVEQRPYTYPTQVEAPMAPPPQHRPAPPPNYVAPQQAKYVKPLGVGLLTDKNVGNYMDGEERELRTNLRGSGVGVTRPGDAITLFLRSDVLFAPNSTTLTPRAAQILTAIANVTS